MRVEKIIEHVKTSPDNAYIWHTTGSGKTLTSFKASQLLIKTARNTASYLCSRP